MRFGKAISCFGLLMVCFILAAQSAKADRIIQINDFSDSITVSPGASISCVLELCTVTLTPPSNGAITTGTSLPQAFHLAESTGSTPFLSTVPVPASDGLNHLNLISRNELEFHSDSSIMSDPPLVGSCVPNLTDCIIEDGLFHEAGTVTWSDQSIDHIQIGSDAPAAEPEPASLILFGSGLVMASGFLRRRRRLVTPSV
jgi:hypothetical protein